MFLQFDVVIMLAEKNTHLHFFYLHEEHFAIVDIRVPIKFQIRSHGSNETYIQLGFDNAIGRCLR